MHDVQGLGASAHFVRASRPSLVRGVKMAPISHPSLYPGLLRSTLISIHQTDVDRLMIRTKSKG